MTDSVTPPAGANADDRALTGADIEAANAKPDDAKNETPAPDAPKAPELKADAHEPDAKAEEAESEDGEGEKAKEPTAEQIKRKAEKTRERIEGLARQNREMKAQIAALEKTASVLEGGAKTPKIEDFETSADYDVALAETAAAKAAAKAERARKEAVETQIGEVSAQAWQARVDLAKQNMPDFEAVAHDQSLAVTQAMGEVIMESEKGPELLYHLGKNPAEALRIAKLPAKQVAYELGKLEGKLTASLQPRKISTAPPPVQTLQGSRAKGEVDLMSLSMEDYVKARGFPE